MCLVIAARQGNQIPAEHIRNGWAANHDGAGFMYVKGGELRIEKGFFKLRRLFEALGGVNYRETPLVIHLRFATHGLINKDCCHPHQVNPSLAMAHNGIINLPVDPAKSDSMLFADKLAKLPPNWHQSGEMLEVLGGYVGTSNKIVLLDSSGELGFINERSGHWVDQVWYSNHGYRPAVPGPGPLWGSSGKWSNTYWPSRKTDTEAESGTCIYCHGALQYRYERLEEVCFDCSMRIDGERNADY